MTSRRRTATWSSRRGHIKPSERVTLAASGLVDGEPRWRRQVLNQTSTVASSRRCSRQRLRHQSHGFPETATPRELRRRLRSTSVEAQERWKPGKLAVRGISDERVIAEEIACSADETVESASSVAVIGFDRDTGKQVWRVPGRNIWMGQFGRGVGIGRSAVAWIESTPERTALLRMVNATDGEDLWRLDVVAGSEILAANDDVLVVGWPDIDAAFRAAEGVGPHATLVVNACDRDHGTLRWTASYPHRGFGYTAAAGASTVAVSSFNESGLIAAYDNSGQPRWSVDGFPTVGDMQVVGRRLDRAPRRVRCAGSRSTPGSSCGAVRTLAQRHRSHRRNGLRPRCHSGTESSGRTNWGGPLDIRPCHRGVFAATTRNRRGSVRRHSVGRRGRRPRSRNGQASVATRSPRWRGMGRDRVTGACSSPAAVRRWIPADPEASSSIALDPIVGSDSMGAQRTSNTERTAGGPIR